MTKNSFLLALAVVVLIVAAFIYFPSRNDETQLVEAQGPPAGAPAQGGPAGWTDSGTVVRLTTQTDQVGIGTNAPVEKVDIAGNLSVLGDIKLSGLIDGLDLSAKAFGWDTAFNERRQWDGDSANLDAVAGRLSLGLGILSTLNAVNGGTGGTIGDNTITNDDLLVGPFTKITKVGTLNDVILKDTDGSNCHKVTVNSAGILNTISVDCGTGEPPLPPPPTPLVSDDFDIYDIGPLNGNNSGAGWTNAWSSNAYNVQNSVVFEGLKAVENQGITATADRRFTPITGKGILSVRMRRTTSSSGKFVAILRENGIAKASVHMRPAGEVGSGGGTLAGQYFPNTWHTLFISFDLVTDKYRVRIDNGPFTPEESFQNNGTADKFDELRMEFDPAAGTAYFDDVAIFPN